MVHPSPLAAAPSPWLHSRAAVLLAMLVLVLGTVLYYARQAWPLVAAVVTLELLVQLGYWLACWLLGRCLLRRVASPDSALGVATAAALGFALLGFAVLALGLLGCLSPAVAWLLLLVPAGIGVVDLYLSRRGVPAGSPPLAAFFREKSGGGWLWLPPAIAVGVSLVAASMLPGTLWRPDDPHPYDSLVYHLQVPREWFEIGRIVPLKHNVYSFFPFNVECHYLLADYLRGTPWQAMYQAQFLSLSLTLLAALAIWGAVAPARGRTSAALAVLAVLTLPWIIMLSCISYVESGMLLFGTLAIAWFVRGLEQKRLTSFALAGVLAGLACGVKLTNVPMLLVGLPLAAVLALLLRPRSLPSLLKPLACFVLCGLLSLSPWLIRNACWSGGNPVFPVAMRQLGKAHFTDTQVERFERAHRPAPAHAPWPARLQRVAGELFANWRYTYVLFPLALVAGALAWKSPAARLHLLLIALILLFWLTSTHLMGRFFILAAVPAALLIASLPRKLITPAAVVITLAAAWCFAAPTPSQPSRNSLSSLLTPWIEKGRLGLFGLQDYATLDEPRLRELLESGREVVFVGDALMFTRQTPMSAVHYATVFDLQTDGRNWIDASYAPAPGICPKDAAIIIDVAECERLRNTYYGIPPLTLPIEGAYWQVMVRR